jgi:hypothetical protein
MGLPRRFIDEFFKLPFPYPDVEKVRSLLESVYEAGLAATPDQDAKRWRKLERDLGEMYGNIIGYERVIPKLSAMDFPPDGHTIGVTHTVKNIPKRELVIRWLDDGEASTLKSMLDAAIKEEEENNKKDL